jgi:hypothetical protein
MKFVFYFKRSQRNSKENKKKKNSVWEHNSCIFYGVKSFLIQNGFLTPETLKTIKILNDKNTNSDQFQNLLNVLDQTSSNKEEKN